MSIPKHRRQEPERASADARSKVGPAPRRGPTKVLESDPDPVAPTSKVAPDPMAVPASPSDKKPAPVTKAPTSARAGTQED